ncbi:MAG: T9SS type A sorting domain-containing protein [Parafilimonas sp.]|nr:T9SS type A sorting domain-containing protein [Parafilimonas sp.]
MKNIYITFLFLLLLFLKTLAQIIPDSLRADWSHAGLQGNIPDTSFIINVKDFGAVGDGTHDDYNVIINAINSSNAFRVIYFPAGNYLIKSSLNIPANVIVRGDGESSNLRFDLSQYQQSTDCITISTSPKTSYIKINGGCYKNSTSVNVANASTFTAGGYAEIKENNGDWDPDKSTSYVGQIVKITSITGNTLSFSPALRLDYIDSLQPKIRPVSLIENAGLECFKITRLDSPTVNASGSNIVLKYANNCWITGVESDYCQTSHIAVISSTHITISGCYVHDAFTFNGGGQGYGIFLHTHTSDSKVENSIFRTLRHAMILASGANGNVYAYNYSFDPRSTTEYPLDNIGDLSLHGHYAYANLLEGNIVQNLIVDDYWGASGPYNTFFRNREELYGIEILDQYNYAVKSERQNLVGNEVTNKDSLKGNYIIQTNNNLTYDNNIKDTIQPPNTNVLNDVSYYLTNKPYFWNISSSWPSIGGNNISNSGSIPAKERYLSGDAKTVCLKPPSATLNVAVTADSIQCYGGLSGIKISATGGVQPYQGVGEFFKPAGNYSFIVTDAFGYSDTEKITIGELAQIVITAKVTKASSCRNDGSVTIKRTGGKAPFKYSLDNISYVSSNMFNTLSDGNYTAYVKDNNGCIDSLQNIVVGRFPMLKISTQKTNVTCKNGNDGSITIIAKGGKPPYLYSLDSINYMSNNAFISLQAGTYTAWIKDANSCTASSTTIIKNGKTNCFSDMNAGNKRLIVFIYPNPSTDQFTLAIKNNKTISFSVTDMYGRIVYSINNQVKNHYEFGDNFIPGVYILKFSNGNNHKVYKLIKQ